MPSILHVRALIERISRKIIIYIPWLLYGVYHRDSELTKTINIDNCLPVSKKNNQILLLGPTGYLSPYLIHSLQKKNPSATIHCLLRTHKDFADPLDYIKSHFEHLEISQIIDWSQVRCLIGDIAMPRLGLNNHDYKFACEKIECIFHVAAWTNHVRPYSWVHAKKKHDLRDTNTLSIVETLRIATTYRIKAVHFTSTLWACSKLTKENKIAEKLPMDMKGNQATNWTGYLISKKIAEILIAKAIRRKIPCTVYRLGQLTGAMSSPPHVAANNHLSLELKSCIELGYAHTQEIVRSFLPGDFAADVIVDIALSGDQTADVYNFYTQHPASWVELIKELKKKGYDIRLCEYKIWLNKLIACGSENSLYPFLGEYKNPFLNNIIFSVGNYVDQGKVDNKRFMDAVNKYGYQCPDVMKLFNLYIDGHIHSGFYPSPPNHAATVKKSDP